MKITHLIYSFTIGGTETMLVDIANEQVKQAVVNVVIINRHYNEKLIFKFDKQVNVYLLNRKIGTKNPISIIRLNCLLAKLSSDVLHCHNHNIIPLLLPSLKKKASLTLHSMGISSKYLSKYNQLFSISESVKKDVSLRANIDTIVIYNGINTSLIKMKHCYYIENDFKIICVGRLSHKIKGQHLVLEALNILKKKRIANIQFDLIGVGKSESHLKDLTFKYGLAGQVNFLGLKDRDYIYSHLKDYDLLVQPSLFEGFGLTVAEGMAAKVPVLVSDIDGPMEIIENGKYGLHFETGNAKKMAEQIQQIILQYATNHLNEMVDAAYLHVTENFEVKTTALNYNFSYINTKC